MAQKLELVIPLYNEEAVVDELISHLNRTFTPEALRARGLSKFHCHFVDDGSRDETAKKLYAHIQAGFPGTLHVLSRNFGHQAAVCAGLDATTGDVVSVLDADLQDPPELVLKMLDQWKSGFQVVYAVRAKRQEFFLKKIAYWCFYRVLAFLSEIDIPRDSGDFSLMDRSVVEALRKLPESLRFNRGLRAWVGFRQCAVAYDRPARQLGSSKYSLKMLYRLATDGIASMSTRVLRITQLFTFIFALVVMGFSVYLGYLLLGHHSQDPMYLYFIIGYFLNAVMGFVIMFVLYILSAYIGRTYLETKRRPPYIVMEKIEGNS